MFCNQQRRIAFHIWSATIPMALLGAAFYLLNVSGFMAASMIIAGIAGSLIGLFILKAGGRIRA